MAGADRNTRDSKHGNTPLHEVSWRGYSRCVKLLCALPKPPKQLAASKGDKSKGTATIQETRGALHSALLGTRNFGGFSALHLAAQNGHNQSCREILLAGGDADVQNNYGDTPLHTACRYGHAGATRILLSANCDLHRVNLNGDTALHIACAMGRRKLTRILLEAGSKVDIKNGQNETPKEIASRKGLSEICLILDTPVDVTKRDHSSTSSHKQRHHTKDEVDHNGMKRNRSKSTRDKKKTAADGKNELKAANWSPYGCHYFPDPRAFPSPKLETLPKEPLIKGEQYYLDLAGNIRKGPVGVANSCYCGPFFKHIEDKIHKNRKSLRRYVDRAAEKLDHKVQALAMKTEDQIGELTRSMITERIRCESRQLHMEHWLKRGVLTRATVAATAKKRKNQENTNTLTRCKSLEMMDNDADFNSSSVPLENGVVTGLSRSFDMLDQHIVEVHQPPSGLSKHDDQFADNKSSGLGSERMDKHSLSVSDDSRMRRSNLRVSSKKSSERSSSLMGSDITNRSATTNRAFNLDADEQQQEENIERLEELLSKTHEIIEIEKASRRRNKSLYLGKTEQSHSLGLLNSSVDVDDSEYIAKEMEKITLSLLKGSHHKPVRNDGSSPEIAKDVHTEKQMHRSDHSDHASLGSRYGHHQYGGALNPQPQQQMMGFYQNSGFGQELASSSSNTLKSEKMTSATAIEEELSELANIRDLHQLKNRILNGSNWKSQVLKRSLHTGDIPSASTSTDDGSRTPDKVESSHPVKYDIRSSEIKTLRKELLAAKAGKVQEIVSRIQSNLSNQYHDEEHNMSESSEDEDEDDAEGEIDNSAKPEMDHSVPVPQLDFGNFNNGILPANYFRAEPQMANCRSGLQQLVPKDAYFHDISNRRQDMQQSFGGARTRHPLPPIGLTEDDLLPQTASGQYPYNDQFVQHQQSRPRLEYYHVYNNEGSVQPQQEKLLASRKFQCYTNLMEMDMDKVALNGQHFEELQMERDSNNDSGYSTKLGGGSSHGPSPSLSGHIDLDMMGHNFNGNALPQRFQQQQHPTGAPYFDYANGGAASSLV